MEKVTQEEALEKYVEDMCSSYTMYKRATLPDGFDSLVAAIARFEVTWRINCLEILISNDKVKETARKLLIHTVNCYGSIYQKSFYLNKYAV